MIATVEKLKVFVVVVVDVAVVVVDRSASNSSTLSPNRKNLSKTEMLKQF